MRKKTSVTEDSEHNILPIYYIHVDKNWDAYALLDANYALFIR